MILWFALGAVGLVAAIWISSVLVMKAKGGAVEVDNDRDINDRFFAESLRRILRPVLADGWGRPTGSRWTWGTLTMRRRAEVVALYRGDLHLTDFRERLAALVVTGDLVIGDGVQVECDLWVLGDVNVGSNCAFRALAADGSVALGESTRVHRWVDAAHTLRLGESVTVVSIASAGEELIMERGCTGWKLAAPVIRITPAEPSGDWASVQKRLIAYRLLREQQTPPPSRILLDSANEWIQPQSTCSAGPLWIGPGTVVLHDLVVRDSLYVGQDSVIAGSIHTDDDCRLGPRVLVTGNVACRRLIMESDSVVGGSVHVDGDATLGHGTLIGLSPDAGGLAVTGSTIIAGSAAVSGRISATRAISTGLGRRKAG